MGIYLNPGNAAFQKARRSQIYVDKTGLIAYYDRTCDSRELFAGLEIEKDPSFEQHLNQYDVLFLNIQRFLSRAKTIENFLPYLEVAVMEELQEMYPDYFGLNQLGLSAALEKIYDKTKKGFVIIIDE